MHAKSVKLVARLVPVFAAACLLVVLAFGCKKSGGSGSSPTQPDTTVTISSGFVKGADISWLTQMEASGYKFYNSAGTAMDCIQLMQSLGINSIRLRVWVNPAGGWNNNADVVAKAIRAKKLGMRILIDFHYSDTWADPGHQTKPAAWTGYDFTTLTSTVYNYTVSVLDTLKANGIAPTWVQVGNETSDGMLWEDGRASTNMANFAALVNAGYRAVKSVNDSIKVIVHLNNGYDNSLYRWMFDGLKSNGANWDIIGMSLYPTAANWQSYNTQCLANMNDMITRYNKQVMICEVGMPADDPATCLSFLTDIISKTKSVANSNALGVFYWEPESYNWQGYGLGAFDNTGKPTIAMNAFKN
jgi:arabinogalactan endo-1,4-beta-galactosidase